jgi:hypothetical protein
VAGRPRALSVIRHSASVRNPTHCHGHAGSSSSGNKGRARLFVRMPRFYFDTYDDRAVPDGEGIILSGLKEAKEEAIKALPDMGPRWSA